MAKVSEEFDSTAINLLGAGTNINGDINSNGDIRINGTVSGNITTKGRLIIGESGKIKGDISCRNADILGNFEGNIQVTELLSLKNSSTVTGEMNIGRLAIEPGCKFNGTCKMNDNSPVSADNKDGK